MTDKDNVDYRYSLDEEFFDKDDVYDIIDFLLQNTFDFPEDTLGHTYFKGTAYSPKPSEFFRSWCMVDDMQCQAYEECGEWSEDFLVHDDLSELDALIKKWLDDNVKVNWYIIKDVKEYKISQEDIDEYVKLSLGEYND